MVYSLLLFKPQGTRNHNGHLPIRHHLRVLNQMSAVKLFHPVGATAFLRRMVEVCGGSILLHAEKA